MKCVILYSSTTSGNFTCQEKATHTVKKRTTKCNITGKGGPSVGPMLGPIPGAFLNDASQRGPYARAAYGTDFDLSQGILAAGDHTDPARALARDGGARNA